jgi:hypothetical protein
LRQLVPFARQVPWAELHALAAQVKAFLTSNYELIPVTRVERAVFAFRYRDITEEVTRHLRAVDAFVVMSRQLQERLLTMPADSAFAGIISAFNAVLEDPRGTRLHVAVVSGQRMSILAQDLAVRALRVSPEQGAPTPIPSERCLKRWWTPSPSWMPIAH